MQLYNSLSRSLQAFPLDGRLVSIYTCGITPYDTTHLGHAFTYTSVDLLVRYLEYRGYAVRYVQNVTDIDDDILRAAAAAGEDWRALGDRWTAHFIEDMLALNVRPPDGFPRATDVIAEIQTTVKQLLQAGAAYVAGGSVYYDLQAWPAYGKLSGLTPEQMLPLANERGNKPQDPNKRDPLDFVLWQAQAQGEPAWDSPWGPGRPGWHIECSAMAGKYLGDSLDLHAGGADLIFPHHESEIAQVEPLTGRDFVRCWMHIAMVEHEGAKMSKSLGNLVMVRDVLQQHSPDALRLYLANHHYRSAWSFGEGALQAAQRRADRLSAAATVAQESRRAETAAGAAGGVADHVKGNRRPEGELGGEAARLAFMQAMEEDLNAPTALEVLDGLAEDVLRAGQDGLPVAQAQHTLRELAAVLGLRLGLGLDRVVERGWREHLARFRPKGRDG